MVTVGVRGGRPIGRQLLRGVAITVGLLLCLLLVATAVDWLLDPDDLHDLSGGRRIGVASGWLFLATALVLTWRQLRRWSERPRWLVSLASVIAVVGLTPAVVMQSPAGAGFISHCVPVADAWRPVLAPPSAADRAFVAAHPKPTHPSLSAMTRQQRDAYTVAFNAWAFAPAQRHLEDHTLWQYGAGSCAVPSRARLGLSAAGLGVGAAALTVAVRRRRRG